MKRDDYSIKINEWYLVILINDFNEYDSVSVEYYINHQ